MLDCPRLLPNKAVQKLIVFFHGYGANGDDLLDIAKIWQPTLDTTAFYAPNGIEPSDVNPFGGYQWFGLKDLTPGNIRPGLDKARPVVQRFLKSLLTHYQLSASDLTLVGFSQGTMLALEMMFSIARLGGIIGYSGAFFPPKTSTLALPPPVLLVHGLMDTLVPYTLMKMTQTQLHQLGVKVITHSCPRLGHDIDAAGIAAGLDFIKYQQQTQPIAL